MNPDTEPKPEAKHSALPWRVNTDNEQIGDIWSVSDDCPVAMAQIIGGIRHPDHERRRANAQLIVTAVNHFAEMRDALEDLVSRWDDGGFYEQGHESLIARSRAILAKVK